MQMKTLNTPLMKRFQAFVQAYPASSIFLISTLYFMWMLWARPFAHPDEGRYIEIPREMLALGDWVTPRLNGVKYFEKPPLFYWLQAIMLKFLGLNEFTMRLVNMLMGVGVVVASFLFARSLLSLRAAWICAVVLMTAPLFFGMAHMITLDMTVTACVVLSMLAFFKAMVTPPSWQRGGWFYLFSLGLALGILAKGIMALAVPGPVIVIWLTWQRQWGRLRPFYPLTCFLLFALVAVPWHVLAALKNPEFLHKYFYVEHFLRFTTNVHNRYQPPWFFVPVLILGLLPWIYRLIHVRPLFQGENKHLNAYLGIWAAWTVLFFSVSNSKLIPYILPAFAPLAILLAQLVWTKRQLLWFAGVAIAINQATIIVAPWCQKASVKPLLEKAQIPPHARLISYRTYFQDLPVYARRIVTLVGAKGELRFGTEVEDCRDWMIEKDDFLILWCGPDKVWAMMKTSHYDELLQEHPELPFYTASATPDLTLVTNKP